MTVDIVVLTHFASPYQIELFDEVARRKRDGFKVYYMHRVHPTRSWQAPTPKHPAVFLQETPDALQQAAIDFRESRFAVIGFYNERPATSILNLRAKSGKTWCFWGERPGFHNRIAGRLLRRWALRALHRSRSPIWGIGRWAVEGYRHEFGNSRQYVDLPYFSDLSRFAASAPAPPARELVFLYSGSFSHRKGVDLLCRAFARLAQSNRHVRLKLMGSGELEGAMRSILAPCADRAEWIGFKEWSELPPVYASAHVLVVPSRYDGWGLVVPEGLASGLPVIGTNHTGAALEFVSEGNGWMTEAGREEDLYDAMRRAAASSEASWMEMSHRARESVREHTLANGAERFLAAAGSTP